jgi:DNA adenine methylase
MKRDKKLISDKDNSAKPFVKWAGGKTQLLSEIELVLPKDFAENNDVIYVEPFIGGGAMLFWILQKYPNIKKAIINDINKDLITTYKVIKKCPRNLIRELYIMQDEYIALDSEGRKDYFYTKRNLFNTKALDDVLNSALFIFLNRTCFNGLYRVNSKGLFNVPHGKYNNPKICDEKTILADSKLLKKVTILCGDFAKTLRYADVNTLYYFDPPYKPLSETSSFNAYSKEEFDDSEQIRLRNFCQKVSDQDSTFILSNSDVRGKNGDMFFDNLYEQYKIKRVLATRMVNANPEKRGKLTEIMVSNK